MKFLFIVQGEGRGHMTQAISLAQILAKSGHELAGVCIGKSERREIPQFVKDNISAPIYSIDSPNFVTDKSGKSIRLGKTMSHNLFRWKHFTNSLRKIHELVEKHQPDVILNFYDLLGGIYSAVYRPKCKYWVIGHQYLIGHPEFPFAEKYLFEKWLFKINTGLTALGSDVQIALSFRAMRKSTHPKLIVMPPLLRQEVRQLSTSKGDFILCYMVNPGYGDEVLCFAKDHPQIKIEAFWDKKGAPTTSKPLPNVTFHQVNDRLYLEKMAACRGLVSTAGFESICEAMYLGKTAMMVPVQGQYEQVCNALDAVISGAGIQADSFDFEFFDQYLLSGKYQQPASKDWADSFEDKFNKLISDKLTAKNQPELVLSLK